MRQRLAQFAMYAGIFLLPWQTRWIFSQLTIQGEPTPFGTLSLYAVELLFVLAVLLRGRVHLVEKSEKAVKALYVLFAAGFLSLTFADQYHLGLIQLFHVIVAGSIFILLCDKRTNMRAVLGWFLGGLFVPSILGWVQVLTGVNPASTLFGLAFQDAQVPGTAVIETMQGRWLRAYGSFPHPNIFGGYLAVGIVSLAWLTRFLDKKFIHVLWIPVVLLASTLITTFSRGAWFGLLVSFLLLIVLMWKRKRLPSGHAMPIIALGLISILGSMFFFHQQIFARFNSELRVEVISVNERASQYSTVGDVFLSRPFLGVGPSGYVFTLASVKPGESMWSYQPIHNAPLLVLCELGLVGFAALFFFLVRIDQINSAVSKTPGGMFGLTLGVCLLVISLFDHYFWSFWPGLALMSLSLGLIVRWSSD